MERPHQREDLPEPSPALDAYGSAMRRRFGLLFHLLGLGFLLRRVRLEQHSSEHIRRAGERGPVAYVLYARSRLDWLALNVALNARRLPLPVYTNRMSAVPFMPIRDVLRRSWRRLQGHRLPDPMSSGWLSRLMSAGRNVCLFMLSPLRSREKALSQGPDIAAALLQAQEHVQKPIQVVPVVVVWHRAPPHARTEAMRAILGEDEPGLLTRLASLLLRREVVVQAGESLEITELEERMAGETEARRVRVLRVALRRHLYREQSLVRGPRVRSRRWMRRLVLNSTAVRRAMEREASATGRSMESVQKKASRFLDKIAARISWPVMRVVDPLTRFLWNRLYSGVDLRDGDMDRIRQASRRGTPVLLPCHRSHLDYMLLSSILYQHDITLPHVAAGINLSFWPAGPILRRLGAFFVKRTFRGDRLFPAVFSQYLRLLLREGYPVEFFIEGGRSRTGKLLHPKLGLLGMVVETASNLSRKDLEITLLPVNITYEQIAEERSYARELSGERKKSESIFDVLKARRVLSNRYGRVYLRVGEPIPLGHSMSALPEPWGELDREEQHEFLQHLGEMVLHRINQDAVVTPTSLVASALLTHPRRGIRRDLLLARVERFRTFLVHIGAEQSATLRWPGWAADQALRRFVAARKLTVYEDEEGQVLRVNDDERITLDYYKNSLIHYFVSSAMLALAIRRQAREKTGSEPLGFIVDLEEARRSCQLLTWLFRYEFVMDPDSDEEGFLREARSRLQVMGALGPGDEVSDWERLHEVAAFMENFVEAYLVVLRAIRGLQSRRLGVDELHGAIRKAGEGMLAVEEVRRPEALSVASLKNAVKALREEGVLRTVNGEPGLQLDEQAWQETRSFLQNLLR